MSKVTKWGTDNGLTVCLRQAGEMLSDRVASEELHDNKFGQLMRNKTVHLLALFLVVYIGVEVTIGGIICSPMLLQQKFNNSKLKDGL
jgi:fucose permease